MTYKTLPKPANNNPQVKEYVSAVQRGQNGRFVMPVAQGWYVRKATSAHGKLFNTKTGAVAYATAKAKKHGAELFIFDQNGQLKIRQKV